jgi:hypothetical protein
MGRKAMKKSVVFLATIFLCFWGTSGFCAKNLPQPDQVKLQADYGGLPLAFIKNQGQVDEQVLYYLKGREGTIYFTKSGIVYDLIRREDRSQETEDVGAHNGQETKDVGAPVPAAQ